MTRPGVRRMSMDDPLPTPRVFLVNGIVVGVERAPSYEYWQSVWPALVRECYGSLAIHERNTKQIDPMRFRTPVYGDPETLVELADALAAATKVDEDRVKDTVRNFISSPFDRSTEDSVDGLTVETLTHDQFKGQVIRDEMKVVYASLFTTKKWSKNGEWMQSNEFAI